MSIIKDTFFGGAEKKAAKSQQQGIERGIQATEKATREAREAAIPLFGQARQDLQQGFQGALDVFGQSLPAQVQAFQGGNVGAQEQLLAGLPLFQNAILGGNVDFSQLQPTQVQTPDLGFFQQQLPGTNPAETQFQGPAQGNPVFQQLANSGFNHQGQNTASSVDFIPRGPGDTFGRFLESQQRGDQPDNLSSSGGFNPGSIFGGLANKAVGNLFNELSPVNINAGAGDNLFNSPVFMGVPPNQNRGGF